MARAEPLLTWRLDIAEAPRPNGRIVRAASGKACESVSRIRRILSIKAAFRSGGAAPPAGVPCRRWLDIRTQADGATRFHEFLRDGALADAGAALT